MTQQSISLDDFLENQSNQPETRMTIEAVEGKADYVKVTPWSPHAGCLCDYAVSVPKSSIETVTPTGDTHLCCNKSLKVVTIKFSAKHQFTLNDIFQELVASYGVSSHLHGSPLTEITPSPYRSYGYSPASINEVMCGWDATDNRI